MKFLTMFLFLFAQTSFAKVIIKNDQLYLETTAGRTPMSTLNTMIDKKEVSKLKLHGDGKAHVISFAKNRGDEKLYSIDHRGFVYDIKPFSNYSVSKVYENGDIEFKQEPGKRYKVTSEGYYVY